VWIISSSWVRLICAGSCEPMPPITTRSEHIGHWIKMRPSLARFSGPESFIHTRSWEGFITTTSAFRFLVHTGVSRLFRRPSRTGLRCGSNSLASAVDKDASSRLPAIALSRYRRERSRVSQAPTPVAKPTAADECSCSPSRGKPQCRRLIIQNDRCDALF
jgi:hypothetical protein